MSKLLARRRRSAGSDPHDLVVAVVTQHADSLLRVARRHTDCADDAQEAYQRALELFVRRVGRLDPGHAHKWLHTVVKHEALAVRRARAALVGAAEETLDALADARHEASTEERAERGAEVARAAEALRGLKAHEVQALWLKAEGLSYAEIAERQAWSYTKVNRCISEGRRSFLERYAGIESGAECERWAPVLSAMVDGEADAQQLAAVRPHLRNCAGCRTVLGGLRATGAPLGLLLPPAVLVGGGAAGAAGAGGGGGLLARLHEALVGAMPERMATAMEATATSKIAAVAASTAALAGGGVAVQEHVGQEPARASQPPRTAPAALTSAPPTPTPTTPGPAPAAPRSSSGERSDERAGHDAEGSPRGRSTEPRPAGAARPPAPGREFAAEEEAAGGAAPAARSSEPQARPRPEPLSPAVAPAPARRSAPPAGPPPGGAPGRSGDAFGFE